MHRGYELYKVASTSHRLNPAVQIISTMGAKKKASTIRILVLYYTEALNNGQKRVFE